MRILKAGPEWLEERVYIGEGRIFLEKVDEDDWMWYIIYTKHNFFFCSCQEQWHCGIK